MPTIIQPRIKSKLTNPRFVDNKYIVDVEFTSDIACELQGGNIRFFFDAYHFSKDVKFVDFVDGYGPLTPTAASGVTYGRVGNLASRSMFTFSGPATYINGAINLITPAKAVSIPIGSYVRIFSIELIPVTTLTNPPIVLDLEVNPANGGFLPGADGWVLACVRQSNTIPGYVTESVNQFNWEYLGTGATMPFGRPTA